MYYWPSHTGAFDSDDSPTLARCAENICHIRLFPRAALQVIDHFKMYMIMTPIFLYHWITPPFIDEMPQ